MARAWAVPPPAATGCDCARFDAALGHLRRRFAARGAGASVPLSEASRIRFAATVQEVYATARCLVACEIAPDARLNPARMLLAAAAYKSRDLGLSDAEIQARLVAAVAATERCLETAPDDRECRTWHASTRGRLAAFSWNPFQVGLPGALLAEFRAARAGLPPGADLRDGAATRGEASLLLHAPRLLGGDPGAARTLMTRAARHRRFACSVSNRMLLAETLARTGDPARGLAELRATVAAGLPSCSEQPYENARALEEAAACLARVAADPALAERWPDACE